MEGILFEVNWTAVIVGAVLAYILGWLWYSEKLFARRWMQGVGISSDGSGPMIMPMVAQAVGTILLSWVIGVTAVLGSLWFAVLITLALGAIVKANGLFVQKSTYAITVEVTYIIAMVAVMVLTHAVI